MEQLKLSVISDARDLIPRACQLISSYQEIRQKSGADFNIFKILKRSTDEEFGHSAFIAELLNPRGSHGQGRVFLDLFFSQIGLAEELGDIDHWRVTTEFGKDMDGRIDILLVGRSESGRSIAVAIENKIYAVDQSGQLTRYWESLNTKFKSNREGEDPTNPPYYLFYLTLYGQEPSDQSINKIPKEALQWKVAEEDRGTSPIRLLSYSNDIIAWLQACHEKIAGCPFARENVSQYIDIVNSLTGNGGGMTDQLKGILDTPEKLFAAAKLSKAVEAIKPEWVQSIWKMLREEWKRRSSLPDGIFVGSLEPNRHAGSLTELDQKSKQYFAKARNIPRYFGLVAKNYSVPEGRVGLEIRFNGYFYVGLFGQDQGKETIFDRKVVEDFFKRTPISQGFDSDIRPNRQKERICIANSVKFDSDSKELFILAIEENRKKFVDSLLDQAEEIIRGMAIHELKALDA
jgi:hypothetical protein